MVLKTKRSYKSPLLNSTQHGLATISVSEWRSQHYSSPLLIHNKCMLPTPLLQALRRLTIYTQHLPPAQQRFFDHLRVLVDFNPTVVTGRGRQLERPRLDPGFTMPKATGYYAVGKGRAPGIYSSWAEAEAQVKGYSGARYKKFKSQAEASAFVEGCVPGFLAYQQPPAGADGRTSATPAPPPAPQPGPSQAAPNPKKRRHDDKPYTPKKPFKYPKARQRANSPVAYADPVNLPPHLQAIADDGFSFSPEHRLVVYTDGSGLNNGKRGAMAGAGVFWGREGRAAACNLAERVPGRMQTNNRGELLSIIRAIETCPYPHLPLEIRTDSQYSISCMTLFLPKWIKNGWKTAGGDVKNADMIKHLLVLLRRRRASVRFKHVRGHAGHAGNEAADVLARRGAVAPIWERDDWLDPDDEDEVAELEEVEGEEEDMDNDVEVEIDPSWLMTEEETTRLELSLEDEEPSTSEAS